MIDWLSQVNPNVILPIVFSGLAWLYHKARGDTKQAHKSLFDDIVENFIYEMLDKYPLNVSVDTYLKSSRQYIEKEIWKVAQKRGIPKNSTTEKLLHSAMERGTAILSREINNLKKLKATTHWNK